MKKNFVKSFFAHRKDRITPLVNALDHIIQSRLFFWAVILIPLGVVIKGALDPTKAYVMYEGALWNFNYITNLDYTAYDPTFHLYDALKKIAWWESRIDGGQCRLLTGLFQLIDIKLRALLFHYIPPIPNFSFSWFLTLLYIPTVIYNYLVRFYRCQPSHGALILAIYFLSPAVVGTVWQDYHPGKTLALSFLVSIIYFASTLEQKLKSNTGLPNLDYIKLGLLIFISLFTDVYSFLSILLLPVFLPSLYWVAPRKWKTSAILKANMMIASVGSLYLVCVKWILPRLFLVLGEKLNYMNGVDNSGIRSTPLGYLLDPQFYAAYLLHIYWFVSGSLGLRQLVFPIYLEHHETFQPHSMTFHHYFPAYFVITLFYLLFGTLAFYYFKKIVKPGNSTRHFSKALLSVLLSIFWVQFVHRFFGPYHPWLTYFYGNIFIFSFLLAMGSVLSSLSHSKVRSIWATLILLSLLPHMYGTSELLNSLHRQLRIHDTRRINLSYELLSHTWSKAKFGDRANLQRQCKIDHKITEAMKSLTQNYNSDSSYSTLTLVATRPEFVECYLLSSFLEESP